MDLLAALKDKLPSLQYRLGYLFTDPCMFIQAMIHRSFIHENPAEGLDHNERLEFLGDSVLGLLVADFLYHRLPTYPEGKLSQIRSRLVDATSCGKYLQKLDLLPHILLGKGERMHANRPKSSIAADVFEALIGAIYLDGGLSAVKSFLFRFFMEEFEEIIQNPPRNYKAELQDFAQKERGASPVYKVLDAQGPDHAKTFHIMVMIGEEELGWGTGLSKKEAEQLAAMEALGKIEKSL